MIYTVIVTVSAKAEADAAYQWLHERTRQYSAKWFNGLLDALQGLDHLPNRCAIAPESRHFDEKIHQLLYGKRPHVYRVLFVTRQTIVYILHIRHGARLEMKADEIQLPQ